MKKVYLTIIFATISFLLIYGQTAFIKENIILTNIELLAEPEGGVATQSCYMSSDIVANAGAASSYTTCNSSTTNSMAYKCGSDKRGTIKYSPWGIPTYTCIK